MKEVRNLIVSGSVFLYLILSGCAGPKIGIESEFHVLSKNIIHQLNALPEKPITIKITDFAELSNIDWEVFYVPIIKHSKYSLENGAAFKYVSKNSTLNQQCHNWV